MLRRFDGLLAALILAALLIWAVLLGRRPEVVAGPVRVVDGDTVELDGRRLRLAGMDAPEMDQTCERDGRSYKCGEVAREALRALIGDEKVECRISGRDRFGRGLAACESSGQDLGRVLVARGLAVSFGRYGVEERDAERRGAGLWAGRFERPSEWRRTHPR
jgi:endonuclease YncB( thermonuclease family)